MINTNSFSGLFSGYRSQFPSAAPGRNGSSNTPTAPHQGAERPGSGYSRLDDGSDEPVNGGTLGEGVNPGTLGGINILG